MRTIEVIPMSEKSLLQKPGTRQAHDLWPFPVSQLVSEMPVKFAKKLEPVKAEIGGDVTLSCELNQPEGQVVWRKDGVELQASKRYQMQEMGEKRILVITGLRAEDKGEYCCESGNDKCSVRVTPRGMDWGPFSPSGAEMGRGSSPRSGQGLRGLGAVPQLVLSR